MVKIKNAVFFIISFRAKLVPRVRALAWRFLRFNFKRIGVGFKFLQGSFLFGGDRLAVGDYCWIECIERYKGVEFAPRLEFGDDVSLSDWVHISCAFRIFIDSGTLIGSKVYIGDHSHGAVESYVGKKSEPPAEKPLDDFGAIAIGKNCWVGDGVVILAGAVIADGSIIAANSVVRLVVQRPALIGGVPAKVIRYFD